MAFKEIQAFEHLGSGVDISITPERAGFDFVSLPRNLLASITTGGRVYLCLIGSGSKMMAFPFNNVGLDMTKKVILGMRMFGVAVPTLTLGIGPGTALPGTGVVSLTTAQLGVNTQAGIYFEFVLDPIKLTIEIFANGARVYTRTNTPAEQAEYSGLHNKIVISGTEANGNGYYVTDFYFRDMENESKEITPLGNFQAQLLTPASVSAPGWVTNPSSNTPLAVVAAIPTSLTTPVLQAERATAAPISVAFSTPNAPLLVTGVKILAACGDSETPRKSMVVSATVDGVSTNGVAILLPATPTLNKSSTMFLKAPSGADWAIQDINKASFKTTIVD